MTEDRPAGIKFLVDMRADVRQAVKQCPATAGPLRALDRSLRYPVCVLPVSGLDVHAQACF